MQIDQLNIIQRVDLLIREAIARAASDIHLETMEDKLRVRFRLDGLLYDQRPIEKIYSAEIISRIKVLARMDIAERRLPQDGKTSLVHDDRSIDLRVSTFPSLYGEKMVLRILDRQASMVGFDTIGLSENIAARFKQLLQKSSGFFLVTGPTGSGKTTTLYAALGLINNPEKNIVTLEDPVEYSIDGITQGYINNDAGFTFERGIRALLRQDPDILMVGEIRDKQTARIAIEAALTGHLVFSTLHTTDAASAIMRLMDMGIDPYLINASVTGVLAQRLVRKICEACRISQELDQRQLHWSKKMMPDLTSSFRGAGCDACNQIGYRGRTGIFELLDFSPQLRALISSAPQFDQIYAQALADGMQTLAMDGAAKVKAGIISLEDLMQVVSI